MSCVPPAIPLNTWQENASCPQNTPPTQKASVFAPIPQEPTVAFDQERASVYDAQFARLAPQRDALHLFIRLVLCELPADANILCVGAGTGAEIVALAQAFPLWRFTAVEPAPPMLAVCRQRAEDCGITARCTFHEGYLDTLPASDPFHAATSLLVSHFLVQQEERREFFRQIAARLHPGGLLVSADITSDQSSPAYQSLLEVWLRMLRYTDMPDAQVGQMPAVLGRDVAVLPAEQVASLIASAGFDAPVLFFQTLLIHAWYAKRLPQKRAAHTSARP